MTQRRILQVLLNENIKTNMNEIPKYNPQIHHRRSIRLKGYDYSQNGLYFITICCHDRAYLFGEIKRIDNLSPQMFLNDAGKIAEECWLAIPNHFPNVILHEYVIMPNHVHGIIEISQKNVPVDVVGAENFLPLHPPEQINIYQNNAPLQNEFQKMIPRSIGSIVKGFKIGVTKWFRYNVGVENIQPIENIQPDKNIQRIDSIKKIIWQRGYYENIIRNADSYRRISAYIINNPANWSVDKFFK